MSNTTLNNNRESSAHNLNMTGGNAGFNGIANENGLSHNTSSNNITSNNHPFF